MSVFWGYWRPTNPQSVARWVRRYLAVDSNRYAGRNPRPRWRWCFFQAALWLAWRTRWRWVTGVAHWAALARWLGFDADSSASPIRWPKLRKEEVPF